MNKTAVKNYAVEARKKWIRAIQQQAAFYGCTEEGSLSEPELVRRLADKGVYLSADEKDAWNRLRMDIDSKGYQNTIEEVAYTWFNRLIAIRFMEVNRYLPSSIRVLSSEEEDRLEPDCVREYERLDFINQNMVAQLAAESDEKLYRYILIEQCRALGKIMPKMFTHIASYAALLLPDRLYIKDGLVYDLTHKIEEKDFKKQVEILGWLYQYYISEKKDEVFASLKKNVKISRENIPAATQLFTPEWIVKYMVENSLGRLWLEYGRRGMAHGNDGDDLRRKWTYYIDEAEQETEVAQQLEELRAGNQIADPTLIKIIDPCMGSGHILVYAFDVLYQIYAQQGYAERDIPDLIISHNIYGLDIDERACQLAYFALMMKARSYNRRFFRRENPEDVPQPQVYSPQGYEEGMEYGSLVKVEELEERPVEKEIIKLFDIPYEVKLNTWNFRRLLHQKYDVVVTNPPYMSSSNMNASLNTYIKKNYSEGKNDLFCSFMLRGLDLSKKNGFVAMITMHSWMFLSRYKDLRDKLLYQTNIECLAHLGAKAFEEIGGEVVQTVAFVFRCSDVSEHKGIYSRLVGLPNSESKALNLNNNVYRFVCKQSIFNDMVDSIFAYWVSDSIHYHFANTHLLEQMGETRQGIATGNNEIFLRLWFEANNTKIKYNAVSQSDMENSGLLYVPYIKGGSFRRWYGNQEYIIKMDSLNYNILLSMGNHLPSRQFYYKAGITWNDVSTALFCARRVSDGFVFDAAGPMCFYGGNLEYLLGLLNTKVTQCFLDVICQGLHYSTGHIPNIPIIIAKETEVLEHVDNCLNISRIDWNSFETSWDFEIHPLITAHKSSKEVQPFLYADVIMEDTVTKQWSILGAPIAQAFAAWERECNSRFDTLKANEEELNRIFIDIYGLQDELTPEVEDKDVTVRKADLGREIRSFISYAVGCMFGRYSLDIPGLAYAGGEWDKSKYSSYIPEGDNILPITDAEYFDDDIVVRFIDFVKVVYGKDTLAENLEFIANALYPNANTTARESIRRYFQNDFFKDHCRIYQKRPIYWLFDSGKQNGFKALIYLHRYDKYTVARVRTEYLHPLQRKYEAEIERMSKLTILPETSARDKGAYKKQIEKINKQIAECRAYDQIIAHIAAQTIELDLDDGVKVNYEKFQGVEVPREDNKGTVKMNLLGKI